MLLVAYDIPNGDGVRVGSCITLSFKHAPRILPASMQGRAGQQIFRAPLQFT